MVGLVIKGWGEGARTSHVSVIELCLKWWLQVDSCLFFFFFISCEVVILVCLSAEFGSIF